MVGENLLKITKFNELCRNDIFKIETSLKENYFPHGKRTCLFFISYMFLEARGDRTCFYSTGMFLPHSRSAEFKTNN